MDDFTFNELVERRGLSLTKSRAVRHDTHALQAWRHSRKHFEHFVSYQKVGKNTPYNGADQLLQFIPIGSSNALFVGAYTVLEEWSFPEDQRQPPFFDPTYENSDNLPHLRYELRREAKFEDLVGRVVIEWGAGTRAWSQWLDRNTKPIIELRANPLDEPFPGFSKFRSTIDEVELIPASWQGALESVGGVYLLVCPVTGELYVGSAYGQSGFMGRWKSYAGNGHGGNRMLMARDRSNYAVSILEVASPDMSDSDVIHRESAWKNKLGSRAHGLNEN